MTEIDLIFLVSQLIAAAIGFGTAWSIRGRQVRKARETVTYMRELWTRLDHSPKAASALRNRGATTAPLRLTTVAASDKKARA